MEQSKLAKAAAMKDAPTMWSKEESVGVMEQRSMRQLPKHAAMKDAPNMPRKEVFALDMGQSKLTKPAAMRDAPSLKL
eukprot:CAMPEP_0202011642 /NCGR_PEP_ID=MMETSP0905-20130828/20647_1 /ASSEMBLY_ACC=CAM_ASM_000554 /TAXON_ID=420261 /ORGANISM="Thalassiosira antarctica, Strain CCMP982" /LENGTH=77 /DNA_ID=CAMNT_0048570583 /DNA_START=29 /DNA_END=259 /DNA_ORIENTATION=-